jgi:hypothetical protein
MPGFMPGIHVFLRKEDVDGRDKPGHDGKYGPSTYDISSRCTAQWAAVARQALWNPLRRPGYFALGQRRSSPPR